MRERENLASQGAREVYALENRSGAAREENWGLLARPAAAGSAPLPTAPDFCGLALGWACSLRVIFFVGSLVNMR